MKSEIAALDQLKIVLEWLMALQERDPLSLHFGLVHVCFHDQQTLGAAYGAQDASKMLNELANKMRSAFRNTDIVARDGTDFWILVPYTSPETVLEKVSLLVRIASDDGLSIVDRDVAVFSLPDCDVVDGIAFASADDLLSHLKQNRQITFRWEHAPASA